MKYKLSAKRNGKWWTYGSFGLNKFDNYSASFKVTPELIELFKEKEGQWVNFSAFEEKPKEQEAPTEQALDDEIPF